MTKRDLRNLAGENGAERRAALAEIRRQAVRLVEKDGRRPSEAARIFKVTPQTMSKWLAWYREGGLRSLDPRKATGRPFDLSDAEVARLKRIIVGKNPSQLDFGMLLWTLPIIQELVRRTFGKDLHATTISRYLDRLGLTPQQPLRRSYKRDERAIRQWALTEFGRVAADVKRKQAVLLFLDEAGVHENAPVGTTWGKKGRRPVVRLSGDRNKINVVSAVAPSGRLWFRCYRGNLDTERFLEFMRALMHDIRGPLVVVMDSHPAHVSEDAQVFYAEKASRLQVELLPKYAPELNPDEHVWGCLKGLFRRHPLMLGEKLAVAVEDAMSEIAKSKSAVRALFGHPDLAYLRAHGV